VAEVETARTAELASLFFAGAESVACLLLIFVFAILAVMNSEFQTAFTPLFFLRNGCCNY
jgi:hypothetical protein